MRTSAKAGISGPPPCSPLLAGGTSTEAAAAPRARTSRWKRLKQENSRLLREDIAARRSVYRGLPEVVTLNHTDLCNLKCIMCARSKAQGKHRLDRAVLEHVTDSLFPTAWKAVLTTSGGEPLAADFALLLDAALKFEVRMDVVTNGTLLTRDLYRQARGALDHLNVSVDCHVPETYEHIRAGSAFSRLERNLAAVRDERATQDDDVLYSFSAVVMKSNLPHLPDLVRFTRRMGAAGLVLQRLKHEIMPMPEEDAEAHFGRENVLSVFEACRQAAREEGVHLYLTDFGLPGVTAGPLRPKLPATIEGQGTCWFIAQNLGVMYTGEVYPCCVPTDHNLGNVVYEDPARIWNGAPFRKLREAHLSGRGTTFCSGCLFAPDLPARKPAAVNRAARKARMALAHVVNTTARRRAAHTRRPIFDPPLPEVLPCDGVFFDATQPLARGAIHHGNELMARHPQDGSLWFVASGVLHRANGPTAPAVPVHLTGNGVATPPSGARATCLRFTPDGGLLLGFEGHGRLLRLLPGTNLLPADGHLHQPAQVALRLSDPRSFVRQCTLACHPESGDVWVGEYGLYPGARCAHLYRSRDGGRRFERVAYLADAKHCHLVLVSQRSNTVIVTTGDLPGERRLYALAESGRFEALPQAWFGFTAGTESENWWHFGSDMPSGNGLLRLRPDLSGVPEFRPFPAALDVQVRQMVALGGSRLLAVGGMDEDIAQADSVAAPLLLSENEGDTWTVIHRFARDRSDLAEGVLALEGGHLATVYSRFPFTFRP